MAATMVAKSSSVRTRSAASRATCACLSHRDTHVRPPQGRRIVDTVPGDGDDLALGLQGLDELKLLGWRDACVNRLLGQVERARPIALAVIGWSPVTISTRRPAERAPLATAAKPSSGVVLYATSPMSCRSCSRASSSTDVSARALGDGDAVLEPLEAQLLRDPFQQGGVVARRGRMLEDDLGRPP